MDTPLQSIRSKRPLRIIEGSLINTYRRNRSELQRYFGVDYAFLHKYVDRLWFVYIYENCKYKKHLFAYSRHNFGNLMSLHACLGDNVAHHFWGKNR